MTLINTNKAKARLNESLVNSSRFLWVSLTTENYVIHKFH